MPRRHRSFSEHAPAAVIDLLALRPDLRDVFPLADQVDLWVRWSA